MARVNLWPDDLDNRAALDDDATWRPSTAIQPHTAYQTRPIDWAVDKLGVRRETLVWSLAPEYAGHAWDGDSDPIARLFDSVARGLDTGVEAATGTQKSYTMAILILWFVAAWEGARVFTFAPKEDQLKLYIWMEITRLWPRFQRHFPTATLTDLTIRVRGGTDDSWGARGYAVGTVAGEAVSTKASGMHAAHMMLVYEEMQGQHPSVLEAGENTCTAPHNFRVAVGNPNHRLDPLHKFCTSPGVTHIRISALDHPNVVTGNPESVPGAVSEVSVARRRRKYGELSPIYQSRVRGLSPEQASDALIRLEWLERAAARWEARRETGRLGHRVTGKGVDVANSEHGDRACIVDFSDNAVVRRDAFPCPDANKLGAQVAREMDEPLAIGFPALPAINVGVDTIGVGAGTVNELKRLRKHIQALNMSASPILQSARAPDGGTYEWVPDANRFENFRGQMYWQLREDYQYDRIDAPRDDDAWDELVAPTFTDEGKVTKVESKEKIKERLGRSPDIADAEAMANWVRQRKGPSYGLGGHDAPHHDPAVALRTTDGKLPRWLGPEHERAGETERVMEMGMDELPGF